MDLSAWYQSEVTLNLLPSQVAIRAQSAPRWLSQLVLKGRMILPKPNSFRRSCVMFRFSRPQRTCSGDMTLPLPYFSCAVRIASTSPARLGAPGLQRTALSNAVNAQNWDPSVKSLTQFPNVLEQMASNLPWTTALGKAYYNDPSDVMNAIQVMRNRAYKAGTLKTSSQLKVNLASLEQEALANRPELREQDYQTRISAAETRKAMLRLLPGLEFSAGGHYDSNSFLVDNRWADYGAKVTWNLFNVLSAPAAIDAAKAGAKTSHNTYDKLCYCHSFSVIRLDPLHFSCTLPFRGR